MEEKPNVSGLFHERSRIIMDELIRRALLGSREAQQECTEKRIALPCPFCGSENIVISNWGLWRVWCQACLGKSDDQLSQADAIRKWNTRPAPPVGRCKDCVWSREPTKEDYTEIGRDVLAYKNSLMCEFCEDARWKDDFCSYFKKREG